MGWPKGGCPESVRRKMSEAKKGVKNSFFGKHLSDEAKHKIGFANRGRKMSDEIKAKISKANRGRKLSDEARRNIAFGKLGEKNPNYGKVFSEEYRRKLSESRKGKVHSKEWGNKISKALAGRTRPKEILLKSWQTRKQSGKPNPRIGSKLSEETKRKLSEAAKLRPKRGNNRKVLSRLYNFRRAHQKAVTGEFTAIEWEKIKKEYNYTCPQCGKREPEIKLTQDHIIPLIKNGRHEAQNIQPLCQSCNSKKWNRAYRVKPNGDWLLF